VGHEWAHVAGLGQRQCSSVLGLRTLRVEPIGMGGDVAEQVQGMGLAAVVPRRKVDGAITQAPRVIQMAKQQTGATERIVG
jgi:hypothetical protein